MIDIYIYCGISIAALSIITILLIKIKKLKINNKEIHNAYLIANGLLSDKHKDSDVHQENFIKFLSDSRESAFEYIEEVQKGLENFVNDVDSHINYFDEYGSVLSEGRPDFVAMTQISKSYKELKKLLPIKENQ